MILNLTCTMCNPVHFVPFSARAVVAAWCVDAVVVTCRIQLAFIDIFTMTMKFKKKSQFYIESIFTQNNPCIYMYQLVYFVQLYTCRLQNHRVTNTMLCNAEVFEKKNPVSAYDFFEQLLFYIIILYGFIWNIDFFPVFTFKCAVNILDKANAGQLV